jgi:hypothetical protein
LAKGPDCAITLAPTVVGQFSGETILREFAIGCMGDGLTLRELVRAWDGDGPASPIEFHRGRITDGGRITLD